MHVTHYLAKISILRHKFLELYKLSDIDERLRSGNMA